MQQHGGEQTPQLALDDQVVDLDPERFGIIGAEQVLGGHLQQVDQDGDAQDDLSDTRLPGGARNRWLPWGRLFGQTARSGLWVVGWRIHSVTLRWFTRWCSARTMALMASTVWLRWQSSLTTT